MGRLRFASSAVDPREQLCLTRIKSAYKMNNIQRGRVTCYKEDIQLTRTFGRYNPVISVQRQSNSRGWLHRVVPRKRHQMRHLCDLACLLAKQVLSQLSYTPTREATL